MELLPEQPANSKILMEYKKNIITAFTLIELTISIVIIAILTTFIIPQYLKSAEKAKAKSAISNLKLIAAAQRNYKLEYNLYYPGDGVTITNLTTINSLLQTNIFDNNWIYSIEGGVIASEDSYSATAQRYAHYSSSPYTNCTYILTVPSASGGGPTQLSENIPEPIPTNTSTCP